MKKTQGSQERTNISLGQAAAYISAATAATVFIALYSSWSFSRGLLLHLNFPQSALSLKGTLDLFPEVGISYTIAFVIAMATGFFVFPVTDQQKLRKRKAIAYISLGILCVLVTISNFGPRNPVYRALVIIATIVSPIIVGFIYHTESHRLKHPFLVLISLVIVFRLYSYNLYSCGREKAEEVLSSLQPLTVERGMAVCKLEEFPIVTVVSREKLMLNIIPRQIDSSFVYAASDSAFIRLVFCDSDRMYFIERCQHTTTSLSVLKTMIEQLVFHSLEQYGDQ